MQPRTFFVRKYKKNLNGKKLLCKQVATLEIAFLKYFAAFMII